MAEGVAKLLASDGTAAADTISTITDLSAAASFTSDKVNVTRATGVTLGLELTDADSSAGEMHVTAFGYFADQALAYQIPIITSTDATGGTTYKTFTAEIDAGSANWGLTVLCQGWSFVEFVFTPQGTPTGIDTLTVKAAAFN
jgi:hypothetical protein